MSSSDNRRSRRGIAAVAAAIGFSGEVTTPFAFIHGLGVELVVTLQMMFMGWIMLCLYLGIGEIHPRGRASEPTSVALREGQSIGMPSGNTGTAQGRSSADERNYCVDRFCEIVLAIVIAPIVALWFWAEYEVYALLSVFPEDTVDYVLQEHREVSMWVGMLLAMATACIRWGRDSHRHRMVKASLVVAVLLVLLWVVVERALYLMLVGYLGHLDVSDYVYLAQVSGWVLLAWFVLGSLALAAFVYLASPAGSKTVGTTTDSHDALPKVCTLPRRVAIVSKS